MLKNRKAYQVLAIGISTAMITGQSPVIAYAEEETAVESSVESIESIDDTEDTEDVTVVSEPEQAEESENIESSSESSESSESIESADDSESSEEESSEEESSSIETSEEELSTEEETTEEEEITETSTEEAEQYLVRFIGLDDIVISEQTVESAADIVVPEAPIVDGYTFEKWNIDIENIELTGDLEIRAVYQEVGIALLSLDGSELLENNYGTAYLYDDGTLSVTACPGGISEKDYPWYAYKDEITSVVFEDTCTFIGQRAFYKYANITGGIEIPSSVKDIGAEAFVECTGITSLKVNNGLNSIGYKAFSRCTGLESVSISDSVKIIGQYAFSNCTNLTSLNLGKGVEAINENAFYNCGITGELVLPDSLKRIGKAYYKNDKDTGAFQNCTKITSIRFGSNLETIYPYTFSGCTGLSGTLNLPDSLVTISMCAFNGCSGLTGDLIIPDKVETIEGNVFQDCTGLDGTLSLPDSLKTIGDWTFANCNFTGSLVIPASVTSIGGYAFQKNSFNGTLTLNEGLESIGQRAFSGIGFTGSLTIPNSVTKIEISAFEECTGFNGTLTLGSNLKSIGSSAFNKCSGLTGDLIIPDSTTKIESYAFYKCSNLSSLTVGNSLKTVGTSAFEGCTNLKGDLTLPDSLTSLGGSAFVSCGFNGKLTISSSLGTIDTNTFDGCQFVGDLIIPDSVQIIRNNAFRNCAFNGTLTLGNALTTIQYGAFNNCKFHGDLVLPDSLTTIGNNAFEGCDRLDGKITFGSSIKTLGDAVFKNCVSLKGDAVIPSSVTSVGSSLYYGCSSLDGAVKIESSTIKTLPMYTFYGCSSLRTLNIPTTLEGIEYYAFQNCSSLEGDLYLPDTLHYVGNSAFENCYKLGTKLIIGSGFGSASQYIGQRAFYNCYGISEIDVTDTCTKIVFKGTNQLGISDKANKVKTTVSDAAKALNCSMYGESNLFQWYRLPVTIKFDTDGGTPVDNVDLFYNETISSPAAKKAGKVFKHWLIDDLSFKEGDTISFTRMKTYKDADNTVTLSAVYEQTYTVSFDTDGGTPVDSITVKSNEKIPDLTTTKEHYVFDGWYKDPELQTPWSSTDNVTSDLTLYAKWTKEYYSVSYYIRSVSDPTMFDAYVGYNTGTYYNEPIRSMWNPTHRSYTFSGWYKDQGLQTPWNPSDVVTADTNLYGEWFMIVNFDSNGGSHVDSQRITPGEAYVIKPVDPTYPGREFLGWYEDDTLLVKWNFATRQVYSNTTLYAKWTGEKFTVSFDTDGAGTVPDQSVEDGKHATEPSKPTKKGYTFTGWYLNNTKYDFSTAVTSNIALKAKWTVAKYTVDFNTDGAGMIPSQSVEYNNTVSKPDTPVRDGYTFVGWFIDDVKYDFSTAVTSDITLTAKWNINKYTVSFDTDGAGMIPSQSVEYNSTATKPTDPIRDKYIFVGWYLNNVKYDFATAVKSDITLTAKWNAVINKYQVSFDTDGGNSIDSQVVKEGSKANKPDTPVREGYTFTGWFIDDVEYNFNDPVTENKIIKAHWNINKYTVSFESNTDVTISSQTVEYKGKATEPTNTLVKEGYKFKYWSTDKNGLSAYNFDDPITENKKLYAIWELVVIPAPTPTPTPTPTPDNNNNSDSEPEKPVTPVNPVVPVNPIVPVIPIAPITPVVPVTPTIIIPEPVIDESIFDIPVIEPTIKIPEKIESEVVTPIIEEDTEIDSDNIIEDVEPIINIEEPLYTGKTDDTENRKGILSKFIEGVKTVGIVFSISLAAVTGVLAILLLLLAWMKRVKVANDVNIDEYSDESFKIVLKTSVSTEGNKIAELFKQQDRVWTLTVPERIIAERVTDTFEVRLNKAFCNRYNGEQLVIVLDNEDEDQIENLGFIIDKNEQVFRFTYNK